MNVLVTGSSGPIGSEAAEHFAALGHTGFGLDVNPCRATARRTLRVHREAVAA